MSDLKTPQSSPFPLFAQWLEEAKRRDPIFYCGMNIATVNEDGFPSVRVVLLKEFDDDGFVFYTNYDSDKAKDLSNNPSISANFWWSDVQRQVRIKGVVEKVSDSQSDQYFNSRPRLSKIAAITSNQSQPIESFSALEERFQHTITHYDENEIKRPSNWGGFRIKPLSIEFWQGLDHRLHHRLKYKQFNGQWEHTFLQP